MANSTFMADMSMPDFVKHQEWLVRLATLGYKRLTNLDNWPTSTRLQNQIRCKHRALGEAVRKQKWKDFQAAAMISEEIMEIMMAMHAEIIKKNENHVKDISPQVEPQDFQGMQRLMQVPAWVARRYSRICKSFIEGTDCPHLMGGKECHFAHSVEELGTGLQNCHWNKRCHRQYGPRPCCCSHGSETVEDVVVRMNLTKKLPSACQRDEMREKLVIRKFTELSDAQYLEIYGSIISQFKNQGFSEEQAITQLRAWDYEYPLGTEIGEKTGIEEADWSYCVPPMHIDVNAECMSQREYEYNALCK